VRLAAPALADIVGRGARSAIGIAVFEEGGFVLDGGRRAEGGIAPILLRLSFPSDWRLLLILDPARQGLHGPGESAAFAALPPFSAALAGQLCHQGLLRLLPGIAERDFAAVSLALGAIQVGLGDYFAAAQHGRYSSPDVGAALATFAAAGIAGIGQSSWGPTGFALVESATRAEALAADLAADRRFAALSFRVVAAANRGAEIFASSGGRS